MADALVVYGADARIRIIRHLRANGPSLRQDIADTTGISRGLVAQSLNKLKITAEPWHESLPAQQRPYALDPARANLLLDVLKNYAGGDAPRR